MRQTKSFFIVLFAFLLMLPALSSVIELPKKLRLGGVSLPLEKEALNLSSFAEGTLQRFFEEKFKRQTATWPLLVRTDNQLNLWIFGQLSSNYDSAVVLGEANSLIERNYLGSFNKVPQANNDAARAVAQKLLALQQALLMHHVQFLLLLSPSKPGFMPELVPARFTVPDRSERRNMAELVVPLLKQYSVNYLDTHALLESESQRIATPMFTPGGTHWNEIAACIVTSALLNKSAELLKKQLLTLSCETRGIRARFAPDSTDLARLANIWFPGRFKWRGPNVLRKVGSANAFRPAVLLEGSSFVFELMRNFEEVQPFSSFNFYYYFNREYTRLRKSHRLEQNLLDLRGAVLSRDLVVLEINEAMLEEVGHGFIEHTLAALEKEKAPSVKKE
jgi:hypothetical protein